MTICAPLELTCTLAQGVHVRRLSNFNVRWLFRPLVPHSLCSMPMQVVARGSRSTEVAAPPTESLDSPPVSAPSRLVIKTVVAENEYLIEDVHPFLPPWIRSCAKTSSMVRHQPKRTRAGVGGTGERPKTQCAPTGRVCVVGDDTRVATGVPLGLGIRTPNRGTLVQLAVGDFQSLEPGLDRSRLKVFPRVLVVRGLVRLILRPGRF